MQGAQVVGVLSKGESVVAAGGHLVTELDPLARHPEKVNLIEYPFSFCLFRPSVTCLRIVNLLTGSSLPLIG